jgi:hypothetical protein
MRTARVSHWHRSSSRNCCSFRSSGSILHPRTPLRRDGCEHSTMSALRRPCASCTASQVGRGDSASSRSTWGCHEPALRCVSKRTQASPLSPTSRICECEWRSRGSARARCRSPSWRVSRLRIRQRVQQRVQAANRHGTQALSICPGTDGPARLVAADQNSRHAS